METLSKNFVAAPTPEENRAKALHWLEKALNLEAEGRSAKMIDMALNKACDYENAATA